VEIQKYSAGKTAIKGALPLVIVGTAALLRLLAARVGVELSTENSYQAATLAFGVVVGVVNWWKNRKRGEVRE